MIEDPTTYPAAVETIALPGVERSLRVQVIRDVLWYHACKTEPVAVVLVRDPSRQWRDAALVATDPSVSAAFVIAGYCRRWSVELTFANAKGLLGLEDPANRVDKAVRRTAPMALVLYSLVVAWVGRCGGRPIRFPDRPWYRRKAEPSFADLWSALRRASWEGNLGGTASCRGGPEPPLAAMMEFASRAG